MVNYERFKHIRNLVDEQVELETRQYRLVEELKNERKSCNHIEVKMGYDYDEIQNCCLICGARDIVPTEYSVDATSYLPEFDTINDYEFNEKFDRIQTMAYGIVRDHNEKNVDDKEIVDKLNDIIGNALKEKETGKTLVR